MSGWERIREARMDVTDYAVHLTRFVVDRDDGKKDVRHGLVRLKGILKLGYLKPTFAPRDTRYGNRNRTVKGPNKAVCFSEQPLEQIPVTLRYGSAYEGYGIAVHKVDLYRYGGRPAVYGDEELLNDLDDERKYLWVRYRPVMSGEDYPNDFSFEREWRSRARDSALLPWAHALEGVPLLLPEDFRRVARLSASERWYFKKTRAPHFRIIVRWDTDVTEIREFIKSLKASESASEYRRIYYFAVKRAQIISLEHVERQLQREKEGYRRVEDLPTADKKQYIAPLNPKKKEWRFLKSAGKALEV